MAAAIKLIVGLGNPGAEYARTRHNAGFMVVDRLAEQWEVSFRAGKAKASVDGRNVMLLKPDQYMNRSGIQTSAVAADNGIAPGEILVISDDFALLLGTLRLRVSGSAGGHNGLKSIIACLGTDAFPRLRCGVGPVPPHWDPADFVLGRFAAEEKAAVEDMVARAAAAVRDILRDGIEKAASKGLN